VHKTVVLLKLLLPQVIKLFQNYRGVGTTFHPTLVDERILVSAPKSLSLMKKYEIRIAYLHNKGQERCPLN
jgi:hypothetical protein